MLLQIRSLLIIVGLLGAIGFQQASSAFEITQAEWEAMKKEIDDVHRQKSAPIVTSHTEQVLDTKYGPDAPATTRAGKLQLGGLVQVWYYGFQTDNRGLFSNKTAGIADSNQARDLSSFRVRRAELNMTMDIHENVTSYVMADFARDEASFTPLEDNQGNAFLPKTGVNQGIGGVQSGAGFAPAILQDALINFHGVVPHHDFTVGQYLPYFSEEDFGPNFVLDFVERSFVGNHFARELGATIHGSWIDNGGGGAYCGGGDNGRVQYWASVFNGASNYHSPEGTFQSQNRADDNNQKDFLGTMLVRPLWKDCFWGSLELGGAAGFGRHGQTGTSDPLNNPAPGLNRKEVFARRYSAWLNYFPQGPVKGMWIKGEYASVHDRNFPGFLPVDLTDPASAGQSPNNPFDTSGFYAAVGYKLSDSIFNSGGGCGCSGGLPSWLIPVEFAARYQQYYNVEIVDPAFANRTNVYQTKEWTAGINYYIKGQNAKIQLNYNVMENPQGPASAPFHNVRNNSFAVCFQVMF